MFSNPKEKLPLWLTILIVFETLPMFIGPLIALTRPAMMGGPEAETINQAAFIYAARNFAVGIALIVAFVLKNRPMLFALILVRLITDLIDLPTLIHFGLVSNVVLVISIFVFIYYIPAVIALWYLWRTTYGTAPPSTASAAMTSDTIKK
ncbi:MAG: hypothetical protein AAFP81_15340 [Pseudomonadota bacterium]